MWLVTLMMGLFFHITHPSTNSEIQKYYQNKPKSNWVYSRNTLLIINLDEHESIGTH